MLFNVMLECCSQRKNLHLHLVLASISWLPIECGHHLPHCDRLQSLHQGLCPPVEIQVTRPPLLSRPCCRRVKKECIDTIIGKSYVGDWFLFYLLGQNIDSVIFKVGQNLKQFKNTLYAFLSRHFLSSNNFASNHATDRTLSCKFSLLASSKFYVS